MRTSRFGRCGRRGCTRRVCRDRRGWALPSVVGRHGAAHRGLEIELVRVTDGARDRSGGGVDQERPTALERGAATVDPVDQACRTYALNAQEPYGIWGALTSSERRRVRASRGLEPLGS
jgi:WhiB family redox-sensing transcriptional regulator